MINRSIRKKNSKHDSLNPLGPKAPLGKCYRPGRQSDMYLYTGVLETGNIRTSMSVYPAT